MIPKSEIKKANEGLNKLFTAHFICPVCKKDIEWECACEEDNPEIECNKCHSKNVEGKIRQTEFGDYEDFTCLDCGNEGSMSL